MGRIKCEGLEIEFDDDDYQDMACSSVHIFETEMEDYFEDHKDYMWFRTEGFDGGMIFYLHGENGMMYGEADVYNSDTFCMNELKSDIFDGWVDSNKDDCEIEFEKRKKQKSDEWFCSLMYYQ